jgi:hypothetical protein
MPCSWNLRFLAVSVLALLAAPVAVARDSNVIVCVIPELPGGPVDVRVTNPDLSEGLLPGGFVVGGKLAAKSGLAVGLPRIDRVVPAQGAPGDTVTIVGAGFDEAGATIVSFGGVPATSVTVLPGTGNKDYYGATKQDYYGAKSAKDEVRAVSALSKIPTGTARVTGEVSMAEVGDGVQLEFVTDFPCDNCELRWAKSDEEESAAWEMVTNAVSRSGTSRPVLTLDPVLQSDTGAYVVYYNDGSGWKRSESFQLTVFNANSLPLYWPPVALALLLAALLMFRYLPGAVRGAR